MRKVTSTALTVGLSLAAVTLCGCAARTVAKKSAAEIPLRTVAHVDLPRYMGDWRVIANIPNFAEKGCVDSIESYYLRPDGVIENWFSFRKKSLDAPRKTLHLAKAVVVNPATNAEWKVKFFGGLFTADYLVLDLDPEYRWAVVGHPSRKYGWVLARDRSLPETTYRGILNRLELQGYDVAKFVKVPQKP